MSLIIAGRFDTFQKAELASQEMQASGFTEEDLSIFYVSSQGQHSRTPIGGDAMNDRGSTAAPKGAGKGVVIGIVLGALAGVTIFLAFRAPLVVTAIGAAVGAYLGSLVGAMSHTRNSKANSKTSLDNAENARHAGVLLAVHAAEETADGATATLRVCEAMDIERTSGLWQRGAWADFDPTKAPLPSNEPH